MKDGLASAGISGAARNNSSALRGVPPGIIYHSVSNLRILQDPDVLGLVRSRPSVSSWPTDVPPPGLFILMFDDSQAVRQWAKSYVTTCSEVPMAVDHFVTGHEVALRTIFSIIAKTPNQQNSSILHIPSMQGETFPVTSFSLTSDPNEIWVGFCQVLRQIPTEAFLRSYGGADCRRVITGHLHDTGPRMYIKRPRMQSEANLFSFIRVCTYTKVHALSPQAVERQSLEWRDTRVPTGRIRCHQG